MDAIIYILHAIAQSLTCAPGERGQERRGVLTSQCDVAAAVVAGLAPPAEPRPAPSPASAWGGPAERHPLVLAVLAAFLGSRIVGVTRRPAGSLPPLQA